jgi:GLPGLI family protein
MKASLLRIKLTVLIASFMLMLSLSAFCQNTLSKVTYSCQATDLIIGSAFSGRNTLYFSASKGVYIHNDYPKENSFKQVGNLATFIKGDSEGMPVFIDLSKKELHYKTPYGHPKTSFILQESLPQIDWQIHSDTKMIGSFNCTKATGNFGGRVYDVWFTSKIPVSLGPYKLWGLPGLILEAKSRDNMVSYYFQSFDPETDDQIDIGKPQEGKEVSWEDFEVFIINKLLKAESLSTPDVRVTNDDPPADYTIERNKFTIISEYKKQRNANKK